MSESTLTARIALSAAASPEEAARICRTLVEEQLAACATLLPGAHSIFHWKGVVEESAETLMLLKTAPDKIDALQARLQELHSYEVPEFLVLDVESGSRRYLDWLHESLHTAQV